MRKFLFSTLFLMLSSVVLGQVTDDGRTVSGQGRIIFKGDAILKDKLEEYQIAGIGTTSFKASNTVDGTANSFNHSLLIQVTLVPMNKASINGVNLVFYSPNDNIGHAASFKDGYLNIYYPVALYQSLRDKLEQAIAAKKKVTVKVIQKTDGYREGTLVF